MENVQPSEYSKKHSKYVLDKSGPSNRGSYTRSGRPTQPESVGSSEEQGYGYSISKKYDEEDKDDMTPS